MLLAGMFFPAMLIVICKSQSPPNDNNLLLPEKTADLYAPTGRLPVDSLIINNEDLLDKYRQFVAKSLVRLHDSCKLHDFLRNINMLPEGIVFLPAINHLGALSNQFTISFQCFLDQTAAMEF